jgi:GNAT superfamily N-acetyltransferase
MTGAKCYGLYDNDEIIGFLAVRHMPHPDNDHIKMVHRFVVLPDYQGIGIGGGFLESIAQMYTDKGFDFRIVTSARNMIHKLGKSDKWITTRYGKVDFDTKTKIKGLKKTYRHVVTGAFLYKGGVSDGKDGQTKKTDRQDRI